MKKITFANEFHQIRSLFSGLRAGQEQIILWQKIDNDVRSVRYAFIEKTLFDQRELWLKAKTAEAFQFKKGTIFCFIDDSQVVFKTSIKEINDHLLCLSYPEEVTLLDSNDQMTEDMNYIRNHGEGNIQDILHLKSLTGPNSPFEPEDDEKYGSIRQSQRIKPKEEKKVLVVRDTDPKGTVFRLLDLSQGGAGLHVTNKELFQLKEIIQITAIDGKPLTKVLVGEVVAIRPLSSENNEFKIGIKFF
jgi:hypothetical protein